MYNDSVIQEQSGLNAFYNKIYSLVGIGVGISALVSGLMMTVFQDLLQVGRLLKIARLLFQSS